MQETPGKSGGNTLQLGQTHWKLSPRQMSRKRQQKMNEKKVQAKTASARGHVASGNRAPNKCGAVLLQLS